jgi:protein-tyrosine phosphatase
MILNSASLALNAKEGVMKAVVSGTSFRPVKLPSGVKGRLFLHSMPGRRESLESVWAEMARLGITCIACLAGPDEIDVKSRDYGYAVRERCTPCEMRSFPIPDFGVPDDDVAFWRFADDMAALLTTGDAVLMHCGAGIGRSGTMATSVLMALGDTLDAALRAVQAAGSHPETPSQHSLLSSRHGR